MKFVRFVSEAWCHSVARPPNERGTQNVQLLLSFGQFSSAFGPDSLFLMKIEVKSVLTFSEYRIMIILLFFVPK